MIHVPIVVGEVVINMEFEEVIDILEKHNKKIELQCKGNPSCCDCERCLKIKGEW